MNSRGWAGTVLWRTAAPAALALMLTLVVGPPAEAGAAPDAPLPGALETSTDAWAVIPMGHLSDPDNTFWQLLRGQAGSSRWSVVTPQGVADNGGIVVGASGGSVVAGFLPSQLLRFSPLSASANGGTTWNPVYLPGALPAHPDALAEGPGQAGALAIVGTNVVRAPPTLSTWSRLVSLSTLRTVAGASDCEPGVVDAVAFTPSATPLVATSCRRNGAVGLFTKTNGTWHDDGVRLGGRLRASGTTVVAVASSGTTSAALVAAQSSGRTYLVALWQSGGGAWSVSTPLLLRSGAAVRSTANGVGGSMTVLVGNQGGDAAYQIFAGGRWLALPIPPAGTVAIASTVPLAPTSAASTPDAFVVNGTELRVFGLTPAGSKWVRVQTTRVPLAYGSSS